jgi:NADH-quinone oxidoreductase subunit A
LQSHPYIWNYLPLLMQVVFVGAMACGMVGMSYFIGRHRNLKEKLEAYECGIPAEGDARGRFSVRFYMVAMLFILFDVEAVFMLPWAVIYRQLPQITGSRFFGFWEMWSIWDLSCSASSTSGRKASSTGPPIKPTCNSTSNPHATSFGSSADKWQKRC